MISLKRAPFLLPAFIVLAAMSVAGALHVQPPTQEQPRANLDTLYSQYPAVDFAGAPAEAPDAKARALRSAKSSRYDRKKIVSDTPGKGLVWFGSEWEVGLSGIPVAQSDAIVVGEVTDARAYLSQDKGAVYSEFTVRADQVLKGGALSSLSPGSTVVADRFGGVVNYGPGHSVLYRAVGQDLPRAGRQYVLFLKRLAGEEAAQHYSLVLGYELRADRIALLDEIPATSTFKGVEASTFLKMIKDAVTQGHLAVTKNDISKETSWPATPASRPRFE